MIAFIRKNSFVLLLLAAFVLSDALISWWDPMASSRRFYKTILQRRFIIMTG